MSEQVRMKSSEQAAFHKVSELRALLEGYAARQAAANPKADYEPLKQCLHRLTKALEERNYSAFLQADFDLHSTIIDLAEVPKLRESWLPVWKGLLGLHHNSFDECWPDTRVLTSEHIHLVNDICRMDPAAAETTARAHIEAVWYRYDEMKQDREGTNPLQRATAYIAFRFSHPITLNTVASKAAYVSPGHLSRLFKAEYGKSFQKYVQELRLDKAAELLRVSKLPITIITERVGYKDISRFGQHFKRRYNATPREYRARNQSPSLQAKD